MCADEAEEVFLAEFDGVVGGSLCSFEEEEHGDAVADEGFDLCFGFFAVSASEEVFEPEGESAQPVDVDAVGESGEWEIVLEECVVEVEVVEEAAGFHDVDDVSAFGGVTDVFDASLFEEYVCKEEVADEAQKAAHFGEHCGGLGGVLQRIGELAALFGGGRSDGF